MTTATVFLVAMFLIYNYVIFELVDAFLKMPRLKKIYRIPVGILNTVVAIGFIMLSGSTSLGAYLAVCILLFTEFVIFYKDKYACSLFCMLACAIHIMTMRSLCVAIFAAATHHTIYDS